MIKKRTTRAASKSISASRFLALPGLCLTAVLLLPAAAHGGVGYNWVSIYPVGGNHYGWGDSDGDGHSNWTSKGIDLAYPYPAADDLAFVTDALTIDEFIDLYTVDSGRTYADSYDLESLTLDAGPYGRRYTIEQYNGGGQLEFGPTFAGGSSDSSIIVRNDAGNDVIACPVDIISGSLTVIGNKLLISGQVSGSNPGTQLIVDGCLLTLSGNNGGSLPVGGKPLGSIVLKSGALFVSSSSNLGDATTSLDFQGGTLQPTASFTAAQSVTIESAGANIVVGPGISLTLGAGVTANGDLNVSGGGTLALATSNAYSGKIIVNGSSTLEVDGNMALSSTSATVVLDAATFTTSSAPLFGGYTVNAHLSLSATGGALSGAGAVFEIPTNVSLTLAGLIDGNGPVTKTGQGIAIFSGVTSYTGSTAVNAGTLTIDGAALSSGATTVAPAAMMNFVNGANAGSGTFADASTSSAALVGGLIQFSGAGTTAGFGVFTINGGFTVNGNSSIAGNGATIIFNSGATAGNATIVVHGASSRYALTSAQALFNNGSTAGNATITTQGGSDPFAGGPAPGGLTLFSGNATAGAATLITNAGSLGGQPGFTEFKDTSNGGTAIITINTGTINLFTDSASAGGATIATHGIYSGLYFYANATAGTALVTTNVDGLTEFDNTSTAGNATIVTANGSGMIAGAVTRFHGSSDAGHAHFTTMGQSPTAGNAGSTLFYDSSTAANGVFTTNGGTGDHGAAGVTQFRNNSTAASGTFTNLGGNDGNGAYGGEIDFYDSSNAGTTATIVNGGATGVVGASGGVTQFFNASKAGTVAITNNSANDNNNRGIGGHTYFNSGASADHATISNNGGIFDNYNRPLQSGNTVFYGGSTADHATLTTAGALIAGGLGGEIDFNAGSDMASATITNYGSAMSGGAGGFTYINGSGVSADTAKFINNGGTVSGAQGGKTYITSSTAGNDTFINNGATASGASGGETDFVGAVTAASATLISNGGANGGTGGVTYFINYQGTIPSGGTARVIANAGGTFDMSGAGGLVSVGSIEGAGAYRLGGGTLASSSLNTDTTVSGVIADGGYYGGSNGSLAKEGTGKLSLTGANTYTGNTTVSAGTLKFSVASGTPTIGASATATVADGATLELAGSISALGTAGGNRAHIVNDSLGAPGASAGLVVSGMNQVVGGIDGSGSVGVNAGSDLSADHIVQSALAIGGTSGSRGLVTIAASDASGNPLAQSAAASSGLSVAGAVESIGPLGGGPDSSSFLPAGSPGFGGDPIRAGSPVNDASGGGNSSAVPEPSSAALAALGFIALVVLVVRSRLAG
jgi:autotransporter-associated beta strand protein